MVDPIELHGNYVELELLNRSHAPALLAAALEDRSNYGYTFVPDTLTDSERLIDVALTEQSRESAMPFVVRTVHDHRVVGTTRFLEIEYWSDLAPTGFPQAVSIGATWYAASAQRTPVNSESKLLLLSHAFDQWNVERVSLQTDARNERSRRAIERIGAKFEGVRRAHRMAVDGTVRDSAFFSIVRAEWNDVRESLEQRLRSASS